MSNILPGNYSPRPKTARLLGVCTRTLNRWEADEALGFPEPAVINNRELDDLEKVAEWMKSRIKKVA